MITLRACRLLVGFMAAASTACGIDHVTIEPATRIAPGAPAWRDLVDQFERQPDAAAEFEEQRFFPFRKAPVVLEGEVRVSRERGLSLHYTSPEERIVVVDRTGMLIRESSGRQSAPDPRANLANSALLNILRFDFPALEKEFEIYGRRHEAEWALGLVPRADALRRAIGNIYVMGAGTAVRTIELRRSAKQHIDIAMSAAHSPATFSADELKKYFR